MKCFLVAFIITASVIARAAEPRPSILFIYAEDIGYYTGERAAREANLRIAGLQTPNLHALPALTRRFKALDRDGDGVWAKSDLESAPNSKETVK